MRLLRYAAVAFTLLVVLAVAGALAAFKGSPGACGPDVPDDPALAVAYERRWIAFNQQIALGQPATLLVDDAEATARARLFLDEAGAPAGDIRICFSPGGGEASGGVDTPLGPDVRVRIKGNADLSGRHPRAQIDEIRVGALPGFVTRPFHGLINGIVDDQTERITLDYPLDVELREGEVEITSESPE